MALCDSLLPALGFRALAGIAMAGMYMPGLRALTHGVEGATRARIAAWYTSSFTIGASLSFLFTVHILDERLDRAVARAFERTCVRYV